VSTSTPTPPTADITIDVGRESTQAVPAATSTDATAPTTTSTPSTGAAPAGDDQPAATSPPATSPPATVPPVDSAPIDVDVVDVAGRTVFGVSVFDAIDVDAVTADVSARLGSPTTDSGWQPTVGQSCAGSTDFRVLWWGDFRMTFERYQGDGVVRDELSAWTVGDPTLFALAPTGDLPAAFPSGIVTLEGIGLGSSLAGIEAVWSNVNDGGDSRLVVVDRGGLLTIRLDGTDRVVGFGDGPFDCPVDEAR
jgi:hypothetical protein